MTWFVRVLLAIDAAAAAVILYFFVIGLADGSVSSFNGALWAATLASVAAILGGGALLNAKGQRGLAIVLLLVLAIPAALFGLFVLAMIVAQPNWR
jgi:hypothetical protein